MFQAKFFFRIRWVTPGNPMPGTLPTHAPLLKRRLDGLVADTHRRQVLREADFCRQFERPQII